MQSTQCMHSIMLFRYLVTINLTKIYICHVYQINLTSIPKWKIKKNIYNAVGGGGGKFKFNSFSKDQDWMIK